MPSTAESIPERLLKRWTVADYHRMIASDVLTSDDRVELLDGQVIEMVAQDPPHASTTDEGSDYLKALFAGRAKVRTQLPVTLSIRSSFDRNRSNIASCLPRHSSRIAEPSYCA
jgi:uncharacterized membrane protein